jgi:cold shock CspA family protein/ribosome-associated translation inhibitor RaiA
MQVPVEITFRGMDRSAAVEERIREKAAWLETFHERIMACRVVVEAPHRHHHKGHIYSVRVDVTVPGAELVASRAPDADHAHEDVYVAVRDAFDAAKRQLEAHSRKHQGREMAHAEHAGHPEGTVGEIFPEQGFGRIDTGDGRSIYFHRNSVLGDGFDALKVGARVRYVEEAGDQGPQASTVHP